MVRKKEEGGEKRRVFALFFRVDASTSPEKRVLNGPRAGDRHARRRRGLARDSVRSQTCKVTCGNRSEPNNDDGQREQRRIESNDLQNIVTAQ